MTPKVLSPGVHCVGCKCVLSDGRIDTGRPQAQYGPPASDWLCRCPKCYQVLTGAKRMSYTPSSDPVPEIVTGYVYQPQPLPPEHAWSIEGRAVHLMSLYAWYREDIQ